MTANQDKDPSEHQAKSSDVQARQADDGSFELVVENAAASASSDSADGGTPARPGADSPRGRSRSFNRLSVIIVAVLAAVGVTVYALSGDESSQSESAEASGQGGSGSFRPYQGGPGNEAANAEAAPVRQVDDEDEPVEEPAVDELPDEPEIVEGDEIADEEWEPEDDSEVVVIEEEHPDEAYDEEVGEDETADDQNRPARLNPKIDTSKFRIPNDRIKLPVQPPKINRIPTPNLQKLQPVQPSGTTPGAGEDGAEYDSAGERFDDQNEGY
jgi:cell division protein FtsN